MIGSDRRKSQDPQCDCKISKFTKFSALKKFNSFTRQHSALHPVSSS